MTVPKVEAVYFGGPPTGPVILLGPSLGTTAATLWGGVVRRLTPDARVAGWDLPGHGRSAPADAFTIADLAAAVLVIADQLGAETFHYAGDSVGGAVGLQLALDAPERVSTSTLMCTGAVIGTPDAWHDRAAAVRANGLASMVDTAPQRWFAPGFIQRHPDIAAALLDDLSRTDPESYALTCEALAAFDVASRLPDIATPVLAVAGRYDVPTPPESLQRIASAVADGESVVLDHVGHLAPAEAPDRVAALIANHAGLRRSVSTVTTAEVYQAGMTARREVLGGEYVDRAVAATTDFTADFQHMITAYAWGGIWTRPGLDRRSRSLITLTALIARGHHEEFAMHLRAARRNGLTDDEIKELIMQSAIYCGVPDANSAFRIAACVLSNENSEGDAS